MNALILHCSHAHLGSFEIGRLSVETQEAPTTEKLATSYLRTEQFRQSGM